MPGDGIDPICPNHSITVEQRRLIDQIGIEEASRHRRPALNHQPADAGYQ